MWRGKGGSTGVNKESENGATVVEKMTLLPKQMFYIRIGDKPLKCF